MKCGYKLAKKHKANIESLNISLFYYVINSVDFFKESHLPLPYTHVHFCPSSSRVELSWSRRGHPWGIGKNGASEGLPGVTFNTYIIVKVS